MPHDVGGGAQPQGEFHGLLERGADLEVGGVLFLELGSGPAFAAPAEGFEFGAEDGGGVGAQVMRVEARLVGGGVGVGTGGKDSDQPTVTRR